MFDQAMVTEWLPSPLQFVTAHQQAGQQPDNLCGPYWVSVLLAAVGVSGYDAAQIAQRARTQLPPGDQTEQWLPAGATSRQDYSVALPIAPHLAVSGTAATGLIRAMAWASQGAYCLIPVQAPWQEATITTVLDLCLAHPDWQAVLLANVSTQPLWGACLPLVDAIAYLNGNDIAAPPPDWQVGHFLTLAGRVSGSARSLVIVRDTYPHLGWNGYHLQPFDRVAAALNRRDSCEGGLLIGVATEHQSAVEHACQAQGWAIAPWDNGTPDPDG